MAWNKDSVLAQYGLWTVARSAAGSTVDMGGLQSVHPRFCHFRV